MKIKVIIVSFLSLLQTGCNCEKEYNINLLLKSNNLNDRMQAYYLIGEDNNIKYLDSLLINLNDPRTSNNLKFKGMSIYQSKMIALKKISNIAPPHKITYRPDSLNIRFYLSWAKTLKHE